MKVNNVILIFEKCTGCLLLVLTMLHLRSDSEDLFDNNHVSHVKRGKKFLLFMLMHAANYSLNHVIKTQRRTSALTGHEWV